MALPVCNQFASIHDCYIAITGKGSVCAYWSEKSRRETRVQEKGKMYTYTPGSYSVLSPREKNSPCPIAMEFARTTSTIYLQKRSKTLSARTTKVAAAA